MMFNEVRNFINDKTDVRCHEVAKQSNEYCAELEYFSPLGEDVIDSVWFKDLTAESFVEGLERLNSEYENACEESAELYIAERPPGTKNFSARQLIDDADAKVKFFKGFMAQITSFVAGKVTDDGTVQTNSAEKKVSYEELLCMFQDYVSNDYDGICDSSIIAEQLEVVGVNADNAEILGFDRYFEEEDE